MEPLSRLILPSLRRHGLAEHALASLVVHRSQRWLADRFPGLARSFRVEKVDGTTLVISCNHSAVAQELQSVTIELLAALAADGDSMPSHVRIVRAGGLAKWPADA